MGYFGKRSVEMGKSARSSRFARITTRSPKIHHPSINKLPLLLHFSMSLKDLYKQASKFAELSVAKVSVVENTDPILKEISDAKSFDDRVCIAEKHWEKLGEGSARTVFKVSDKLTIKIAINDAGIAQNFSEADIHKQCAITNPIYAFDAKGKWILCAFNESITVKEFKELTGMSFAMFSNAIQYKFDSETDKPPPKDYDDIEKNPVFQQTIELILATDLLCGDIGKISSWGRLGEKVILRDTGLTKKVHKNFYGSDNKPDSSSSPSSSAKSDEE